MPTEMKLANDCTECLTAFIKSRAAQAEQSDCHEVVSATPAKQFGTTQRPNSDLHTLSGWRFGDYGVEQERQDAISALDSMMSARKARLKFFDNDLFFDPTWAMLLDLYRCDLTGTDLCVSSLCIGSGVPSTTALRYLQVLEDRGYVERVSDKTDKRRSFIRLTTKTRGAMASYIQTINRYS